MVDKCQHPPLVVEVGLVGLELVRGCQLQQEPLTQLPLALVAAKIKMEVIQYFQQLHLMQVGKVVDITSHLAPRQEAVVLVAAAMDQILEITLVEQVTLRPPHHLKVAMAVMGSMALIILLAVVAGRAPQVLPQQHLLEQMADQERHRLFPAHQ